MGIVGEAITETRRADPGTRPLEFRVAESRSAPLETATASTAAHPSEDLDLLARRIGIEAVVRREQAKEAGSLADYLRASRVLNLTEHRLEPEQLKPLAALEQKDPAKLFEKLRRGEKAEQAEVQLIQKMRDRLSAVGQQNSNELRFTVEHTQAPVSDGPGYMLMLSLPEGRDPRDWVNGQSAGRRLDRNTGAVVLSVTSPELRRACRSLLEELPSGVGSIGHEALRQLLTFGPTRHVSSRAQDSFDTPLSADPAGAILQAALLRHPTENRIHLLPRAVLRTRPPAAA